MYRLFLAWVRGTWQSCATVFTVLGVLVGVGCDQARPPSAAAPPPPPPPEVLVAPVIQQDVPVYSEWLGTTDGSINAQIRARVQGYLQVRHYREGVFVKTG